MEIRVGCIVRIIRKFGSFPVGTVGCVAGLSEDGKSCVLAMWDELGNTCGRIECGVDSLDMLEEEDLVTLEKRIREGTDNLLKPDGEGILKGRAGVPIKFVKEDRDLIRTLVPSEGIDDSGEKVIFPIGSIGVLSESSASIRRSHVRSGMRPTIRSILPSSNSISWRYWTLKNALKSPRDPLITMMIHQKAR